jgi:hypothetical protein
MQAALPRPVANVPVAQRMYADLQTRDWKICCCFACDGGGQERCPLRFVFGVDGEELCVGRLFEDGPIETEHEDLVSFYSWWVLRHGAGVRAVD